MTGLLVFKKNAKFFWRLTASLAPVRMKDGYHQARTEIYVSVLNYGHVTIKTGQWKFCGTSPTKFDISWIHLPSVTCKNMDEQTAACHRFKNMFISTNFPLTHKFPLKFPITHKFPIIHKFPLKLPLTNNFPLKFPITQKFALKFPITHNFP